MVHVEFFLYFMKKTENMGCTGSKEAKFELASEDRQRIHQLAEGTLQKSDDFKMNAALIAPRVSGISATPSAFVKDSSPVRSYFRGEELPPQLGDGTRSVAQLVTQMKLAAADESKSSLMPDAKAKYPQLQKDYRARMQAENVIASESDRAMNQVAQQYVQGLLPAQQSAAQPGAQSGGVQRSDSPAPAIPHRVMSEQNRNESAEGAVRQPRTESMRGGEDGMHSAEQAVLPNGNWDKAENTDFYWSEDEKLFFHPQSGQFYDPATAKWYDPDNDEWYDEE